MLSNEIESAIDDEYSGMKKEYWESVREWIRAEYPLCFAVQLIAFFLVLPESSTRLVGLECLLSMFAVITVLTGYMMIKARLIFPFYDDAVLRVENGCCRYANWYK